MISINIITERTNIYIFTFIVILLNNYDNVVFVIKILIEIIFTNINYVLNLNTRDYN